MSRSSFVLKTLRSLWAALLLLLAASCTEPPQLSAVPKDGVMLTFGDSLTFGTGASKDRSYPTVLADLSDRTVINAGVPGEVSAQGASRLPAALDRYRPSLLVLCHGGNDILRGNSEAQTRANLARMIEAARERGVQVVLIGVPARSLLLETADLYRELARRYEVPLEDGIISTVLADRSLRADRIHPNSEGYRRIAAAVHQLLRERGALP